MARVRRTSGRRALTLLEVLLVLALLIVLASVVWPALEPVLASLELRKSAEQVRVQWDRARVDSLATGRTILFRYEPKTNRYCLEPRPEPQFVPGGQSARSQTSESDTQVREDVLPKRITFLDSEISDSTNRTLPVETGLTAEGNWSDPLVFYPDGTASDARLTLQNERGQCIELSLRGLTGVVTIGDVYAGAEATR